MGEKVGDGGLNLSVTVAGGGGRGGGFGLGCFLKWFKGGLRVVWVVWVVWIGLNGVGFQGFCMERRERCLERAKARWGFVSLGYSWGWLGSLRLFLRLGSYGMIFDVAKTVFAFRCLMVGDIRAVAHREECYGCPARTIISRQVVGFLSKNHGI